MGLFKRLKAREPSGSSSAVAAVASSHSSRSNDVILPQRSPPLPSSTHQHYVHQITPHSTADNGAIPYATQHRTNALHSNSLGRRSAYSPAAAAAAAASTTAAIRTTSNAAGTNNRFDGAVKQRNRSATNPVDIRHVHVEHRSSPLSSTNAQQMSRSYSSNHTPSRAQSRIFSSAVLKQSATASGSNSLSSSPRTHKGPVSTNGANAASAAAPATDYATEHEVYQTHLKARTPLAHEFDDEGKAEEIADDQMFSFVNPVPNRLRQSSANGSTASSPYAGLGVTMSDDKENAVVVEAIASTSKIDEVNAHRRVSHERDERLSPSTPSKSRWRNSLYRASPRPQTSDGTRSRMASFKSVGELSSNSTTLQSPRLFSLYRSTESLVPPSSLHLETPDRKASYSERDTTLRSENARRSSVASSTVQSHCDEKSEDGHGSRSGRRVRQISTSASQVFVNGMKQARTRGGTFANFIHDKVVANNAPESDSIHSSRVKADAWDQDDLHDRYSNSNGISNLSLLHRTSTNESRSPLNRRLSRLDVGPRAHDAGRQHSMLDNDDASSGIECALKKIGPTSDGLPFDDLMGRVEVIRQAVASHATSIARKRADKKKGRGIGRPHTSQGQAMTSASDYEDAMMTLEVAAETQMKKHLMDKTAHTIDYRNIHLAAAFVEARREMDMSLTSWRLHDMFDSTDVQVASSSSSNDKPHGKALDATMLTVRHERPVSLMPAPRKRRSASSKREPLATAVAATSSAEAAVEYENVLRQATQPGSPLLYYQALGKNSSTAVHRSTKSSDATEHAESQRDGSLERATDDGLSDRFDVASRRDSNVTSVNPQTPKSFSGAFSSCSTNSTSVPSSPCMDDKSIPLPTLPLEHNVKHAEATSHLHVLTPEEFSSSRALPRDRPSSRGVVKPSPMSSHDTIVYPIHDA